MKPSNMIDWTTPITVAQLLKAFDNWSIFVRIESCDMESIVTGRLKDWMFNQPESFLCLANEHVMSFGCNDYVLIVRLSKPIEEINISEEE